METEIGRGRGGGGRRRERSETDDVELLGLVAMHWTNSRPPEGESNRRYKRRRCDGGWTGECFGFGNNFDIFGKGTKQRVERDLIKEDEFKSLI